MIKAENFEYIRCVGAKIYYFLEIAFVYHMIKCHLVNIALSSSSMEQPSDAAGFK